MMIVLGSRRRLASGLVLVAVGVIVSLQSSADAFAPPRTLPSATHRRAFARPALEALPPQLADGWCSVPPSLITSQVAEVDPFSDSISFFDGPILTMAGGAVAVMVLLVAFKSLMGKMDEAIGKVLVDFEEAMKTTYPQRWVEMEEELEGLEGVDRDVKLYELMDQMEKENPNFMARVKDTMGKR